MGFFACKFDAYSGVWHDITFRNLCKFYEIEQYVDSFMSEVVPTFSNQVYGNYANFSFNSILFSIPSFEYSNCRNSQSNLMDYQFSTVRVQMMGQALDWMRSVGIAVDHSVSPLLDYNEKFNLTRIDIAFDFVNYAEAAGFDIFQRFENYVQKKQDNLSPAGRLCIQGLKSGISYSKKYGSSERTLYIGTPNSDRLLRIYDKYLERSASNGGDFNDTSFGDPKKVNDWTRIEWQLRNTAAIKVLYSPSFSFMSVLREIYDFYQFYSPKNGSFRSWLNFIDPDQIQSKLV